MDMSLCLLALLAIITSLYWYLTRTYSYWSSRNVPSAPDPVPGFGHMFPVVFLRENLLNLVDRLYKSCDSSLVGFYFIRQPAILVRDPALIKRIMFNDFDSFSNNGFRVNKRDDPILAKHPFFATGMAWKTSRARTGSNLTGKKLRSQFVIVSGVGKIMNTFVERKIKEESGSYECELRDFFTRFTGEFVANSGFAIEGQCYEDQPDEKAFASIVKGASFAPTFMNGLKQALIFYLPDLAKYLRVRLFPEEEEAFMRQVCKTVVEARKKTNTKPDDYMQFILDANSEDDIETIVADLVTFYGDTYVTTSSTLAILFYHLSENVDVQDKLRAHVKLVLKENDGAVTYDTLKNFTYLDQVIQESMRMLPALGVLLKCCTQQITLDCSDGIKCQLHPGDLVMIPSNSVQQDDKYWPDPLKFDPDRFTSEKQASREKGLFLPFGEGPRLCIGQRLALMNIKLASVLLIKDYKIVRSSKMKLPLELDPNGLVTYVKGGLWAKFEKAN